MTYYLTLSPRDPIIARDGRPFGVGQGHRMRSVDWPYPSVLAGSLRTLLGKMAGGEFVSNMVHALKEIEVAGPLPLLNNQLYFPAPKDLMLWEAEQAMDPRKKRKVMTLRPMSRGDGQKICDLPDGLFPVGVTQDVKPAKAPAFWSNLQMCRWLMNPSGEGFEAPPEKAALESGYFDTPERDERTHVKIDPAMGASEESLLFMTVGLDLSSRDSAAEVALAARIEARNGFVKHLESLNTCHPLGGERRLIHWRTEHSQAWNCRSDLVETLRSARQVRLILATPAVFKDGWKPGWLDERLEGCPPGADVRLKLVGACVDRWKPISGWSLEMVDERGKPRKPGPKEVRRLVPAGSVYFFDVVHGSAATLAEKFWLRAVSDEGQDRRDGFGLALWGIWNNANQAKEES
ncbi:MAG: type III-B CRISPR module-associated protein Cmr3 [Acidobacteria bacterium]|nr:type III-B CRISPR module-associated protein Cmr3 [Acidobacteriota bacterium]MBI3657022.1 type III-B CRISPR module-associated protein Cmr3 [Acidobacteriota bacterium]